MKLRVLFFDDEDFFAVELFEKDGVEIELIGETTEEIGRSRPLGGYRVTQRSLLLAREATPEKYDVIIIGNNLGTGISKARELPPEVHNRTMIAWNEYRPGNEQPYAAMGFTHFGNRVNWAGSTALDIELFIRTVIGRMKATR